MNLSTSLRVIWHSVRPQPDCRLASQLRREPSRQSRRSDLTHADSSEIMSLPIAKEEFSSSCNVRHSGGGFSRLAWLNLGHRKFRRRPHYSSGCANQNSVIAAPSQQTLPERTRPCNRDGQKVRWNQCIPGRTTGFKNSPLSDLYVSGLQQTLSSQPNFVVTTVSDQCSAFCHGEH